MTPHVVAWFAASLSWRPRYRFRADGPLYVPLYWACVNASAQPVLNRLVFRRPAGTWVCA